MNPAVFSELANEIIKMSGLLGSDKSFIEGLTPKQVHIIMEIGRNSFRHGDLAGRLSVDPSTLTRTLNPLATAGLVDRQLNPENRREVIICLTDKGIATLAEINNKMNEFCGQILSHVPTDKAREVESTLEILLNIIKGLHGEH